MNTPPSADGFNQQKEARAGLNRRLPGDGRRGERRLCGRKRVARQTQLLGNIRRRLMQDRDVMS